MPSPLIQELIESKGVPLVDEDSLEAFTQQHTSVWLFFTESPMQFPESNDVAVVLPLLMQEFGDRFNLAVVDRSCERKLQARFPFDSWPALVHLRDGKYIGAITRMQDWDVYLSEIAKLLTAEPSKLRGFAVPVVSAEQACH
jgi:hydrogenase-1 operon protein HyaE